MKLNTKKLLEEYSNRNKDIINYIKNNDWTTLSDPSFSFVTEKTLITNLIKNIKFFIEEVNDDVVLKPVRKFLDDTNGILTDHLSKIKNYFSASSRLQSLEEEVNSLQSTLMEYGDFDLLDEEEQTTVKEIRKLLSAKTKRQRELIKFEDELFTHKISVVNSLTKVDISSDNNSSAQLFYNDKKAPLIMREILCEKMPIVKGKTDLIGLDFNASVINPASSTEMLRNMRPQDIPVYDSTKHFFDQEKSTIQFWEEEIRKIKYGVNIGGYFIDPYLYWHLNIFKLTLGFGQTKVAKNVDFRDNEYYFNEMLKKTEREGKAGLLMFGSRRIAKSVNASSYTLFRNSTIPNCKSFIGGFSENPDLLAILDYVQDATNNTFPALKTELLTNSIDKGIQMGIRIDAQNSIKMATTRVINMEGGSKRGKLKGAAQTPDAGLIDEVGKGDILDFWRAYLPAVATGNDKQPYRCTTLLLGTPGDETLSKQAEEMLQHPEDHKLVVMDWDMYDKNVPEEHRTWDSKSKFSFFVPAQLSLEAGEKRKTSLADFLGMDNEALKKIEFYETKWEEKSTKFRDRRTKFSRDAAMLYQEQKNFPINVDECFTHTSFNRFPGKAAVKKRTEILERGEEGRKVRLRKDPLTNQIVADTTNDPLVMVYPWVGGNISAPICILEEPKENTPFALYTVGVDDVKHKTSDGSSLFSVTVYKRGYLGGEWAERIVAHYTTRDEDMEHMYLQTYYLIKYYNALCLVENEDENFLSFYERNFPNDLKHLSDGVDFSFRMNLVHRKNRKFGFAADTRNISLIENTLEIYTKQKNVIINGEDGFSGIDRIYDIGLLQELGGYRKGQNADRIRTASMAITFGRFLDEWKLHRYLPETEDDIRRKKQRAEENVDIFGNEDLSGLDIWS